MARPLLEPSLSMSGFPKSSICKTPNRKKPRVTFSSTLPEHIFIIQSRFSQEMPVYLEELLNRIHQVKRQLRKEKKKVLRVRRAEEDLSKTIEQLCACNGDLYETLWMQKQIDAFKAMLWNLKDDIKWFRVDTIRIKGRYNTLMQLPVAERKKKITFTTTSIQETAKEFWMQATTAITYDLQPYRLATAATCA